MNTFKADAPFTATDLLANMKPFKANTPFTVSDLELVAVLAQKYTTMKKLIDSRAIQTELKKRYRRQRTSQQITALIEKYKHYKEAEKQMRLSLPNFDPYFPVSLYEAIEMAQRARRMRLDMDAAIAREQEKKNKPGKQPTRWSERLAAKNQTDM